LNFELEEEFSLTEGLLLNHNTFFPRTLSRFLTKKERKEKLNKSLKSYISKFYLKNTFSTLKGFLTYGLKNNFFDIPEIKSWFDYESEEDREEFEGLIDGLEESVIESE